MAVSFQWQAASLADSYDLEIASDSVFTNIVYQAADLLGTSHDVANTTFAAGNTYYWRVRAKNESGPGTWSTAWSFNVKTNTAAPSANDITFSTVPTVGQQTTISAHVSDVDGNLSTVEFRIDGTLVDTDAVTGSSDVEYTNWTPAASGTYVIRIDVYDTNGLSDFLEKTVTVA